jgi:hypothetical protein
MSTTSFPTNNKLCGAQPSSTMATTEQSSPGSPELVTPSPSSAQRGSPDISDPEPDAAKYSATDVLAMSDEEFDRHLAGPQRDSILGIFFGELTAEERNQLAQKLR